jgi:pantoate--beta-alanine ligase
VALTLPRALRAGEGAADKGPAAVLAAAREILGGEPALAVDYVAVVDPRTFGPVRPGPAGPALLVAAARAGGTRLIDNVPVVLAADPAIESSAAEGGPHDAATEGPAGDAAHH